MDREYYKLLLRVKTEEYLKINPDRFDNKEKEKFRKGIEEFLSESEETIDDEVYDFLIYSKIYEKPTRENVFISHLNKKYSNLKFKKIMDVGAGRMCRLSSSLAKLGCQMYAIDPKIRLTQKEAKSLGIKSIKQDRFLCDEFANGRNGTNIERFDMIVGLEPCDATEHIIRQCLKYEKPFDILLCAAAHNALNGTKFNNYKDWYEYLSSISSEVKIKQDGNEYYATNYQIER